MTSCAPKQPARRTIGIPSVSQGDIDRQRKENADSNGANTGIHEPILPDSTSDTATSETITRQSTSHILWSWPETTLPQDNQVLVFDEGAAPRMLSIAEAQETGYRLVDLSDDWVPYIFWSKTPPSSEEKSGRDIVSDGRGGETEEYGGGDFKANSYAKTYVRLANDEIDVDGRRLKSGLHNHLEVYGIPPTLAVLRRRWLSEKDNACLTPEAEALFKDYYGPVKVTSSRGLRRLKARFAETKTLLMSAAQADVIDDQALDRLAAMPEYSAQVETYRRDHWRIRAAEVAQERLRCEALLSKRSRVRLGVLDGRTREALKRFEKKNHIYGWGKIYRDTAEALGRSSRENIFEAFKRVVAERVISSIGLVEDGSVSASFIGRDGQSHALRNTITEFRDAAMVQLGIGSVEDMDAFFDRIDEIKTRRLIVGLRLPELPEYYSEHMDLEVSIDRGDIWYDIPLDKKKRFKRRSRARYPKTTLYVRYLDQKIPLVKWRTTIGGWQKEKRGNEVYVKYKVSDIGRRYWRNIIAGPVWVPPPGAPTGDMVKHRPVGRKYQSVVGQSTTGPGFASAYGLVAAFHVTKNGFDNQIRTHGSVNYMSIKSGYSHGCHRLRNVNAVRLFSFVLQHRHFRRKGQSKLAFHRKFEHKGESFQINLHTRGYYYDMQPPIPVIVNEGRIRGAQKKPLNDYVKLPTKMYQEDMPELKRRQHKGAPLKQNAADSQNEDTKIDSRGLKSVQSL